MIKRAALLVLVLFAGCQAAIYGTAKDLNRISVGMTRDQVISALGDPSSTAAYGQGEYLIYKKMAAVVSDWPRDYFVKIEQGKVVSFGQKGDFDSTKDPTIDLNVRSDATIHQQSTSIPAQPSQSNLDKLEQLYKLKQTGAITNEEYEQQKERLLK